VTRRAAPDQPALFDPPMARRSDPISSHQAADQHALSGKAAAHRAIARTLVQIFPGRTSRQLGTDPDCLCKIRDLGGDPRLEWRYELGRRLSEVAKLNQVYPLLIPGPRTRALLLTWFDGPKPIHLCRAYGCGNRRERCREHPETIRDKRFTD